MALFYVKTIACDLDISAQLLNLPLDATLMVSPTTNYSLLWTIVSSTTSWHFFSRFLGSITANPRSELAFVCFLMSSAMARQDSPFLLAKIVRQVRKGYLAALSMMETNSPSSMTLSVAFLSLP